MAIFALEEVIFVTLVMLYCVCVCMIYIHVCMYTYRYGMEIICRQVRNWSKATLGNPLRNKFLIIESGTVKFEKIES